MEMPNIKHPVSFEARGVVFSVVSYHRLTDDQARRIVLQHLRFNGAPNRKVKAFTIIWTGDPDF